MIAALRHSTSFAGTRIEDAGSAISEILPTFVETNGVPHASDSRKTFGSPSELLVRIVASAA